MFLLWVCLYALPVIQISSDGRSLTFTGEGTINQAFARSKGNFQNIQSVNIDGPLTLDTSAFESFTSMKSITLSNSLKNINSECFKSCKSLEEFSFPEGITSISDGLFRDCSSLQKIFISATINTINTYLLFQGCSSLSYIDVSLNNPILSTDTSHHFLLSKDGSVLYLASGVKNQEIPSSVKIIDKYCYYSLTLTSIDFSKSQLEEVKKQAFNQITIDVLNFPPTLKRIEGSAFYQSHIPTISIPSSLTYFDPSALNEIRTLNNLEVENSPALKKIDGIVYDAQETMIFFIDMEINEINLSKNIGFIETSRVRSTNIVNVNVANGSISYSSYEGVLYNSDGTTLIACPGGKLEVTVYSKCKTIGEMAFMNCNIERVTLNEGLTTLGHQSFSSCKSLVSINFPSTLVSISSFSFYSSSSLGIDIKFPKSLSTISGYVFTDSGVVSADFGECYQITSLEGSIFSYSKLMRIVLPPGLISISEYALVNSQIEAIEFPNTVTDLGKNCFQNCKKLKNIDISNTLITNIPDSCFEGSGIESIKLSPKLTSISTRAFALCESLSSIEFASGTQLNSIAPAIISGCKSLKTFSVPLSVATINDGAFAYSYGLTDFILFDPTSNSNPKYIVKEGILFSENGKVLFAFPGGRAEAEIGSDVSGIRVLAFEGCASLETLRFSESCTIQSLGENTFLDCAALRDIVLAGSIQEISSTTFAGCLKIKSVQFAGESKLESIPAGAFKGCSQLNYFEFQPKLQKIGDSAFEGTAFPSLNLQTVKSIGARAFANCQKLQMVKIFNTLDELDNSAYDECSTLSDFSFCGKGPHTVTFSGCKLSYVKVSVGYAGDMFGQKPVLRILDEDCLMPTGLFTSSQQTCLYEMLFIGSFIASDE